MAKKAADVRDPVPALLDADPTTVDAEERRRLGNQKRRYVRRQRYRRRSLEKVRELDPAYHDELVALRAVSPQKFRQALVRFLVKNGIYEDRLYTSRDHPADLMARLAAETEEG